MRPMNTRETHIPFMKMHGLGNDFVIIDSRGQLGRVDNTLAKAMGDRHRGVGFDQLAELTDSPTGDVHLTFWNSDGTAAGACGNATRCIAPIFFSRQARQSYTSQPSAAISMRMKQAMASPPSIWGPTSELGRDSPRRGHGHSGTAD